MTAVVAGLPRSWQTAPEHDRDLLRAIEIVDAPPRLIDDLQRVDPDVALGMPFGLLRAADERLQLGEQPRDDAELHAPAPARSTAAAPSSSFSISPQMRSAGRSSSGMSRHSARVSSSSVELEPRRKLHGAQHAQAVVAERRRIDDAEKPALDVAAAVAGVEVLAGQRIPGDRVDREVAPPHRLVERHRRIAGDVEAAVPAAGFRFAPRQRDVDVARLVDLEAFADGFDAAEALRGAGAGDRPARRRLRCRCPCDVAAHQPIAHPAADDERAAAGVAHGLGDALRAIERSGPFWARSRRRVRRTRPAHDCGSPVCGRTS